MAGRTFWLKLPHFARDKKSRDTKHRTSIWFIFNCRLFMVRQWIITAQLRRFCILTSSRWKIIYMRLARGRVSSNADWLLNIYSRWYLAGSLSLQPAAVAGNKRIDERFLSPAWKASLVSKETVETTSRSGNTYKSRVVESKCLATDERIREPS